MDKTFGLKNKKGAKQQKYVQHVTHQVKNQGQSQAALAAQKAEERKKKTMVDELGDLNKLLKPVVEMPKISKEVDPKSVLCVFFKQGSCGKGNKCKFSHDLSIERKAEKRNMYVDNRDLEKDADTLDNWDEEKLNEVVQTKHAEADKNKPRTAIICKYFLEALEEAKYGWFWECPNGDKCIYRHALPPGFILKKDKKKLDEMNKEDQISLEDLIEKERAALGVNLGKVTLESFTAWKKRKVREKRERRAAEETRKRGDFAQGRQVGLSGRDLFTFNPDLVTQDDDDADDVHYHAERLPDEDEEMAVEINEHMFDVTDADDEGTSGGQSMANEQPVQIDEALFDADDLPDSDLDDDMEDGSAAETNGHEFLTNGVASLNVADAT